MSGDLDNMSAEDAEFIGSLRASKQSVDLTAAWLSKRGYPVIVRPIFERPTVEDITDYQDDGDLEIIQRVEVKHRSLTFTCAADFPFPTITVDSCASWDRAKSKPYAYILWNQSLSAMCIIYGRTFRFWEKVERYNSKKGHRRSYYDCPIEHGVFFQFGTA